MSLNHRLSAIATGLAVSLTLVAALLEPSMAFAADPAPTTSVPAATAPSAPTAPAAVSATALPVTGAEASAATPAPSTEKIDNPYGLSALWKGGDFVARATLLILVLMSISSWYVIITKLLDHLKLRGQAAAANNHFWQSASVHAGAAALDDGSPYRFIADTGIKSTSHHEGALLEQIDLNTWITMSIQRAVEKVQSRLQDGLALLATVGSTAPFVGLFGTVWGIYNALTAIGIAGQASIDKVAGPVGEALIMTALGLGVAVPAVLGYNFLVRRNKGAMENIRSFSNDLHSVLLSGVMSTANKKG